MTKEEFKKIRMDAGYTQHYIAHLLNISVRTVQRYESGQTKLNQGLAELLSYKIKETTSWIGVLP